VRIYFVHHSSYIYKYLVPGTCEVVQRTVKRNNVYIAHARRVRLFIQVQCVWCAKLKSCVWDVFSDLIEFPTNSNNTLPPPFSKGLSDTIRLLYATGVAIVPEKLKYLLAPTVSEINTTKCDE